MPIDHKHFTDPTYLRSIYDGLSAGSINKDNATALPIGLVGVYEEALPPASNVSERKKFLEFFAVWAILKKEVSVAFVLPLLEGWTEQEVVDYIGRYSKWFNSPGSGTYILYHERLRAFVKQKISHKQFRDCNALLVKNAQAALIDKIGNEWKRYALEYLSSHLLISAIETGDASDLKTLAYNANHWNRQIEISKGFEWSKNMLNDMMLWASKYDDDEVIECALNKVDLYHLEQNDAPRIVELVAQNDIETALNRIEAFGGNDKEGLQRKFILYMLCLMELTLLDSKDKPFRKEAIDKLLKHFDDNLPIDHSVLNWNDFFPSYLMFQMACEWAEMGLDYLHIFNYTNKLESDWLFNKSLDLSEMELDVLKSIDNFINDQFFSYNFLLYELKKNDSKDLLSLKKISLNSYFTTKLMVYNSKLLFSKQLTYLADNQLNIAIQNCKDVKNFYYKIQLLTLIGCEYYAQGNSTATLRLFTIIYKEIYTIDKQDEVDNYIYFLIDKYLSYIELEKAISLTYEIKNPYYKCLSIILILRNLNKKQIDDFIQDVFRLLVYIEDDYEKAQVQKKLAIFLYEQNGIKEAIFYANTIEGGGGWYRDDAIGDIAIQMVNNNEIDNALHLIKDSQIVFIKASEFYKYYCFDAINKNVLENALKILDLIVENDDKNEVIYKILNWTLNNCDSILTSNYLKSLLEIKVCIKDEYDKNKLIFNGILSIVQNKRIDEALLLANRELGSFEKCIVFIAISDVYSLMGKFNLSEIFLNKSIDEVLQIESKLASDYLNQEIIKYLIKNKNPEKAKVICRKIDDELDRFIVLLKIHDSEYKAGLFKENKYQDKEIITLFNESQNMLDFGNRCISFSLLTTGLYNIGIVNFNNFFYNEIFSNLNSCTDLIEKSYILSKISTEFYLQNKFDEADSLVYGVVDSVIKLTDLNTKSIVINSLISELIIQKKFQIVEILLCNINDRNELLECLGYLGSKLFDLYGCNMAIEFLDYFSDFNRTIIYKGIVKSTMSEQDAQKYTLHLIKKFPNDLDSILLILNQYAVYQIINDNINQLKINRINKTLDINWALKVIKK